VESGENEEEWRKKNGERRKKNGERGRDSLHLQMSHSKLSLKKKKKDDTRVG